MPRGFVWCIYVDDLAGQWAVRVDRDYAADPDRGWFEVGEEGLPPLPRQWRPRRVVGIDESGREQVAIAGSLAAAIWTGLVPTFVFETSDATLAVADIIATEQERSFLAQNLLTP